MSNLDTHVSDLRWDQLIANDLAARDATSALRHAEGCASCHARFVELREESAAFASRPFPWATTRSTRMLAIGALLAAAGIAAIVFVRNSDDEPTTRSKGVGAKLVLAAGPEGRLTVIASGDVVHPGDYVQATYTAERDGFGAVLARDGNGAAFTYVPSQGTAMVPLPAGTMRSFPESTVLDDVVGSETIVVVWCETQHALADLVIELGADCTAHRVELAKREVSR